MSPDILRLGGGLEFESEWRHFQMSPKGVRGGRKVQIIKCRHPKCQHLNVSTLQCRYLKMLPRQTSPPQKVVTSHGIIKYHHLIATSELRARFFCFSLTRGRACGRWCLKKTKKKQTEHEKGHFFWYDWAREPCNTRTQHRLSARGCTRDNAISTSAPSYTHIYVW